MTPIFLISYNRPSMLKAVIERLQELNADENIIIIDNNSTFPPLLDYYTSTSYEVIHLPKNFGHTVLEHLWADSLFRKKYQLDKTDYVYTDCDIVPHHDCPNHFLDYFKELLQKFHWAEKIGFGLKIDDLPNYSSLIAHKDQNKEWGQIWQRQTSFWETQLETQVYKAPIDTTFALRRAGTKPGLTWNAIRTGHPYIAHHLPWYLDERKFDDEYLYYLKSISPTSGRTSNLQKDYYLHDKVS